MLSALLLTAVFLGDPVKPLVETVGEDGVVTVEVAGRSIVIPCPKGMVRVTPAMAGVVEFADAVKGGDDKLLLASFIPKSHESDALKGNAIAVPVLAYVVVSTDMLEDHDFDEAAVAATRDDIEATRFRQGDRRVRSVSRAYTFCRTHKMEDEPDRVVFVTVASLQSLAVLQAVLGPVTDEDELQQQDLAWVDALLAANPSGSKRDRNFLDNLHSPWAIVVMGVLFTGVMAGILGTFVWLDRRVGARPKRRHTPASKDGPVVD